MAGERTNAEGLIAKRRQELEEAEREMEQAKKANDLIHESWVVNVLRPWNQSPDHRNLPWVDKYPGYLEAHDNYELAREKVKKANLRGSRASATAVMTTPSTRAIPTVCGLFGLFRGKKAVCQGVSGLGRIRA